MDETVLRGLLQLLGISLVPPAVFFVALHTGDVLTWWRERRGPRAEVLPLRAAAPLEQLVERLRRLRPEVHAPRPGTSRAKHLGALMAYDEALSAVAAALDLPTSLLGHAPEGFQREVERLRLEHALAGAGIELRPAA